MSSPKRFTQVTVIGSSEADERLVELAYEAGKALGVIAGTIITGGRGGVMEAVSRGAKESGATTVGILPGDSLKEGNGFLDIVIPSGIGWARNMTNVLAGDVVVSIGGASGTLNELSYAWMHGRPIVALVGGGGWSDRLAGQSLDGRRDDTIIQASDVQELQKIVANILRDRKC